MTDFIAQKANPKGTAYVGASIGIFDPDKAARDILGDVRGGQLFAYLFRRFGYPNSGWDERKDLTQYLITTPMDAVFLYVQPYMGGDYRNAYSDRTRHMFGYCIAKETEKQLYRIDSWKVEDTEVYQSINNALKAAIRDLLRPVFVRDVPINCYGRIADEEFDGLPEEAERAKEAGYGIPASFFEDTDRYDKFLDALHALGGSLEGGMERVIALAEEEH